MMLIMPSRPTMARPPRLSDLPPRDHVPDDDEVTGVVEEAFDVPDPDQTGRVLSYRDLEEVETVHAAIKLLLRRHTGPARELVRARLACALEDA